MELSCASIIYIKLYRNVQRFMDYVTSTIFCATSSGTTGSKLVLPNLHLLQIRIHRCQTRVLLYRISRFILLHSSKKILYCTLLILFFDRRVHAEFLNRDDTNRWNRRATELFSSCCLFIFLHEPTQTHSILIHTEEFQPNLWWRWRMKNKVGMMLLPILYL